MLKLSQGEQVKKQLLQWSKENDAAGNEAAALKKIMTYHSCSRLLQTLFEDCSQLPQSQSKLATIYQTIGCTDRAMSQALVAARSNDLTIQEKIEARMVVVRCCIHQNNLDEAKEILREVLQRLKDKQLSDTTKKLQVKSLLVECLQKKGMPEEALDHQEQYLTECASLYGISSVEYALGLVEKGKLLAGCKRYEEAEQHQQRAIDILIELSFNKANIVPDLYVTLAAYQRHNESLQNEYSSLVKAKNIYNELLAGNSPKLIDVRRNIGLNLEARGRLYECLKEWGEIREMEKCCYGEITVQVGRSERMIGRLYAALEKPIQAIKHYLRAASIFEENGERKIAAELEELVKGLRERKSGYRKVLKSMHNR